MSLPSRQSPKPNKHLDGHLWGSYFSSPSHVAYRFEMIQSGTGVTWMNRFELDGTHEWIDPGDDSTVWNPLPLQPQCMIFAKDPEGIAITNGHPILYLQKMFYLQQWFWYVSTELEAPYGISLPETAIFRHFDVNRIKPLPQRPRNHTCRCGSPALALFSGVECESPKCQWYKA